MKYTILLTLLSIIHIGLGAQGVKKTINSKVGGIYWMSLDQVNEKMKTEPKKVYIDIYTDWCGWCKVMDKKTFTNKKVIEFMNANFYCIHLDAETKDSLEFKGKKYGRIDQGKTNQLAVEFMNNNLSYPTSIFFDENFMNPQPVPGYLDVKDLEMISTYIAGNKHKTIPFEKFKQSFKATW